ncbi:MAG TPA: ATP-grasp domain-containing protein [Gaiellaceae bacterium]
MIGIVGSMENDGTAALVRRWAELGLDVELLGGEALDLLRPGDVAVGRLDVRRSLDGVEDGLLRLLLLERRGVRVLNRASSLLAAHDKLRTARLLARAGVPHPSTRHARPGAPVATTAPVVLKPRFGSWGIDVARCATAADVDAYLRGAAPKAWYRRHGLLIQEEVPSAGRDLRVLLASGRVVGAIERVAAAGEWRTNVSCGATARPAKVPEPARELAATAAAALDADLVGVDLLPLGADRWVVVELNGAVDFDDDYASAGDDVFALAADALRVRTGASSAPRVAAARR